MPNDRLAASDPAIDWNTRSTGAPASIARSVVVRCASTHACVGTAKREISSSSIVSRSAVRCTLSVAGLMPMTASPQPYSRPSRIAAAMPAGSSVGWLGCRRTASRPGNPMVSRKAVTTRQRRATAIRSWLRISFETAATISGVSPGASAASASPVAASDSSQSRKPPTVRWATGAKAAASRPSMISRVTSSLSCGTSASVRNRDSGSSASVQRAATRSASEPAATPASTSPERCADAFASTAFRSANSQRVPAIVCA